MKNPVKNFFRNVLTSAIVVCVIGLFFLIVVTQTIPGIYIKERDAITALENQGFSEVVIKDKDITFVTWSGCGSEDDAAFEVEAKNALGKRVSVVACAGWPFKGFTVRTK